MRSTEEYIDMIADRIRAEHKKHPKLDWAQIAATKIVKNLVWYERAHVMRVADLDAIVLEIFRDRRKDTTEYLKMANKQAAEIRERINTLINNKEQYMNLTTTKQLIEKYQKSSDEMLRSLKEDELDQPAKDEWYGYMRGVRDCAFEAGILSETTIQENLLEASKIQLNKE